MKIAIVGTGISGLAAAYYLQQDHDITVFEASDTIGGHTATIDVDYQGQHYAVDTGFIVYNDWTYPNFIRLLDELGVESKPTEMSFSVSCEATGLEYAGSNLNTLFSQRRNLVSPYFLRLLRDIVRFNKTVVGDVEQGVVPDDMTLGDYLASNGYSDGFSRHYLVPMAAAIWSSGHDVIEQFPLKFFVRFFNNHGLLNIANRPQWRVIAGGSREYLEPLTRGFVDRIRVNTPIRTIERQADRVLLTTAQDEQLTFDQVIIASHSDQALGMLQDASEHERAVLRAIPYQDNEVVLHTDERLLPKQPRAWSSWNYRLTADQQQAGLTYNMNILQHLDAPATFCVSLNQSERIDPAKVIQTFNYSHPVFTLAGVDAQHCWQKINGVNRTWFCGAYWRNGFHEDGLHSALRVVAAIRKQQTTQSSDHSITEGSDAECDLSRLSLA